MKHNMAAVGPGLKGRMEKRLPNVVVVNLARVQDRPANATELTYTENISAHGVCVISKRAWQPGELALVTSFEDQIALPGKVVHCRKCGGDRYAVGLVFQGLEVTWMKSRSSVLRALSATSSPSKSL